MYSSVHSRVPEGPPTEGQRRRSAMMATLYLAFYGVIALVGATLPWFFGMLDAVPPWMASGLFVAAALLAFAAAWLEFVRHRRAETLTAFAVAGGVATTWASTVNGWYVFAPIIGLATLAAMIGLAYRAINREELRHTYVEGSSEAGYARARPTVRDLRRPPRA